MVNWIVVHRNKWRSTRQIECNKGVLIVKLIVCSNELLAMIHMKSKQLRYFWFIISNTKAIHMEK